MRKIVQGVLIGSVLCGPWAIAPVVANEVVYSANVSMVTRYVWRGWLLNHDWSGQGGFDVSYGGFSGGIWGGTDENLGTEIDLFVNYGGEINEDFSYSVGFIQYRYPNKDVENNEANVTLNYKSLSGTYHRGEDDYEYYELNYGFDLGHNVTLDLHAGYEDAGWRDWKDYQMMVTYHFDDSYSIFMALSDKEDNEEQFYAGIKGQF